jgi:hypothetical protein
MTAGDVTWLTSTFDLASDDDACAELYMSARREISSCATSRAGSNTFSLTADDGRSVLLQLGEEKPEEDLGSVIAS